MRFALAACCAVVVGMQTKAASLELAGNFPATCDYDQFISPRSAWCGDVHNLLQTEDGGRTWRTVSTPSKLEDDNLWQFQLLNAHEAWIRTFGGFYWTEDGGKTWKAVSLPPLWHVDAVHFATSQLGWAVGLRAVPGDPRDQIKYRIVDEHTVAVPTLYRTTDRGRTWAPQPYPDLGGLPHRLQFADAQHGLSIELNATLFTRDGGRTWKKSDYCVGVDVDKLHNAEIGTGIFLGTTAHLLDAEYGWWSVEGDILTTTNGGETWCQLPSVQIQGEIVSIHEVRFATHKQGWAVAKLEGHWDAPLPPFETIDGGKSWMPIKTPPGARIEGCSALSDGTVYFWGDGQLYKLAR